MVEKKFMAWDETESKMIHYANIWQNRQPSRKVSIAPNVEGDVLNKIHLMQYAGVKSKEGVEIYEDFIVRHERIVDNGGFMGDSEDFYIVRVGYITITPSSGVTLNGFIHVYNTDGDMVSSNKYNKNPGSWERFAEVLGNRYENPEILKSDIMLGADHVEI